MFTRRLACMTCKNVPLTILKSLLLANELTLNTDFWEILKVYQKLACIAWSWLICNRLQQTATDCNTRTTLHHAATNCNKLHHTAPHCTPLHPTATHCNTLPHTSTCPMGPSSPCTPLQHTAPHCTTLQHIATLWNAIQPAPWALPAPTPIDIVAGKISQKSDP